MKAKYRAILIAITVSALTAATGAVATSPAMAKDYILTANQMSWMFTANGCHYRVQYGTYGSTPYAFLRTYYPCRTSANRVASRWTDGVQVREVPVNIVTQASGWDSCSPTYGAYHEMGGPIARTGYGVGMTIYLADVGVTNRFHYNFGAGTSGIYC